jgi:thioredoxin-like negative regulator of GroEL
MKAAWEQLGDEYAGSSSVVVGDVDCTVETELSTEHGVSGYPTIKYWKDGESKDYSGGRSLDDLTKFVKDNLEAVCDVKEPKDCDEKENKYIAKMNTKSADDIKKQLDRLNGMKGDSMKAELKQWLHKRINILKQL